MKKHYYLGLNAKHRRAWRYLFTNGSEGDLEALSGYLGQKYDGEAILTKNGRSALAMALKAYFEPGDGVIVNGFTCYAVIEAIKAAGLVPIYADINRADLNFDTSTLEKTWVDSTISGIIIQNTLGNPVDIKAIERFAKKHSLVIIEDLAHCAGVKYADGREAGTIGAATVLSFGKDKSIDTISGGAVILRHSHKHTIRAPKKLPKVSDRIRSRIYPLIAGMVRGASYLHLGGVLMTLAIKLHLVEKSADNKLDLTRTIAPAEAKLALGQLLALNPEGERPLREFYLVKDRAEALNELKAAGYYFTGLWYETPIAPARYYKKANFDEKACPVATEVANQIINFPTHYSTTELIPARKIIQKYLINGGKDAGKMA